MTAQPVQLPTTQAGPGIGAIMDRLWRRRVLALPWHEHAREMSDHYNGRIVIPMPEIDADERPAAANLIAQNLDQHAMRVAMAQPSKTVAPLAATKTAEKTARSQYRALARFDQINQMNLLDRRRARWLATWSCAPVIIRPDPVKQGPMWELRNPLGCYPAPTTRWDDMVPTDTICTYIQDFAWLKLNQPQAAQALQLAKPPGARMFRADDLFEIVEYNDAEVTVLAAVGVDPTPQLGMLNELAFPSIGLPANAKGQTYALELLRIPNLAERPTGVIPGRITLDAPKGLADDMVGIYQMETKLLALYVNAVARGIYPDTWFVEQPGQGGEIVTMADGLTGVVGHVRGGTISNIGMTANPQTAGVIAALEANVQAAGAVPSEWGGRSQSNVRTAQRGQDIASNSAGFYIHEAQEVLACAKQHEYQIAAAVDKAYFKNNKKSFYVNFGKERGELEYKPGELWDTIPEIDVRYFFGGMDPSGLAVLLGQMLGEGTMSVETAMRINPNIVDEEAERGRVIADHIHTGMEQGFVAQITSGAVPLADAARVAELVASGDYKFYEAIQKAQQESQQRQATAAPQGSPETQVGLQAGPQGSAQPTISGPNQSQTNLRSLLAALGGR